MSGREDLNLRPFGPEPNALPDCATPRYSPCRKGFQAEAQSPSYAAKAAKIITNGFHRHKKLHDVLIAIAVIRFRQWRSIQIFLGNSVADAIVRIKPTAKVDSLATLRAKRAKRCRPVGRWDFALADGAAWDVHHGPCSSMRARTQVACVVLRLRRETRHCLVHARDPSRLCWEFCEIFGRVGATRGCGRET